MYGSLCLLISAYQSEASTVPQRLGDRRLYLPWLLHLIGMVPGLWLKQSWVVKLAKGWAKILSQRGREKKNYTKESKSSKKREVRGQQDTEETCLKFSQLEANVKAIYLSIWERLTRHLSLFTRKTRAINFSGRKGIGTGASSNMADFSYNMAYCFSSPLFWLLFQSLSPGSCDEVSNKK